MTEATPPVHRVPEIPYGASMPVVVRRAAATFGDDDYVVMLERRISFGDAERASRRLAKELLAAGVGKGTRVGIHMPTGPEWAVAFIAVTRIGALAMPYSTLYRPAELRNAMRIGDVAVLLASPTMLGKDHEAFLEDAIPGLSSAPAGRLRIPQLPYLRSVRLLGPTDRSWAEESEITPRDAGDAIDGIDDALLEVVEAEVTPADPMVVVFTSGTTADPKGVVHTQGGVVRKTAPMVGHGLDTTFPGRVLSINPFFWIGGVQQVMGALQSGAAILTLERLEAEAALTLAKREGATSFNGNALRLQSLFGSPTPPGIDTLRPLPKRPWEGPHSSTGEPPTPFGMTETFGPWSGIEEFDVRVVDPETGDDLPTGEVGEYWVRGYALMAGLYKREREETFTPDGYYRTGDLGYAEFGQVYFKSRLNEMIKIKAANVAPAEVEAALTSRPDVRVAVVVGLAHEEWGQEVAAAIVPADGHTIDVDALKAELRTQISPYKVPTRLVVMREEELPYLATSKVDKRAVAAMLARQPPAGG
jgi:acyl-CoA synthetase (AMP-forming)/AMP-acid ligase II